MESSTDIQLPIASTSEVKPEEIPPKSASPKRKIDESDQESSIAALNDRYQRRDTGFVKFDKNTCFYPGFLLEDCDMMFKLEGRWFKTVAAYLKSKDAKVGDLYDLLVSGYYAKVKRCWGLQAKLNATGNRIIVYCGEEDMNLGCGLKIDDPSADKPNLWDGKNVLGYALMQVRCLVKEDWKCNFLNGQGILVNKQKKTKTE